MPLSVRAPLGARDDGRKSFRRGSPPIPAVMTSILQHSDWLNGRVPDTVRLRLRQLVEVVGYLPHHQPLAVITADAVLLGANRPFLDLLGASGDEDLGSDWDDFMPGWTHRTGGGDEPHICAFEDYLLPGDGRAGVGARRRLPGVHSRGGGRDRGGACRLGAVRAGPATRQRGLGRAPATGDPRPAAGDPQRVRRAARPGRHARLRLAVPAPRARGVRGRR